MYSRSVTVMRSEETDESAYPFSIPAVKAIDRLAFSRQVTFFVGENGSGKSTLLEAIAYQCGFHSAGGSKNNDYDVDAAHSALGEYLRLSWMPKITNGFFLRAETFYQFASHLDALFKEDPVNALRPYGDKSLHEQSHGEAFLSLFQHRFGKRAVYLLDEPEAALSPSRQLALLRIMKDLEKEAQFIIATHSPILLGYPDAEILDFDEQPIRPVKYEETLHYILTRRFLENRNAVLRDLFGEEEEDGDG